jgi:oligopeptide transport system ATP-binding protein
MTAPARDELLAVENLEVQFRTGRGVVQAVRGTSFTVAKGETLAIIGESGSGKSVTARVILGILQSPPGFVTGGAVRYHGENFLDKTPEERRKIQGDRIAMVFQDALAALNPVFPIGWQIAELFRVHRGMSKADGYKQAVKLLARVGIPNPEERVKQYAHQFSGGMRQRVMIAMAIALEPDLLLADEPTTALDVTVQAQVMQLLAQLKEETGMALMLITHNVAVAAEVADRVAVMYAGRVVEVGTVDTVLQRPGHPYSRALIDLAMHVSDVGQAPIPGSPPDMIRPPKGCAFHPRCPMARDICKHDDPALRILASGQQSACHFAEEVSP